MYCENCGSKIDEGQDICHGCGISTDRTTTDIKNIADNIKKKEYCEHCGNIISNEIKNEIIPELVPEEDNIKTHEDDIKTYEDDIKTYEDDIKPYEDDIKPYEDDIKPYEDDIKPKIIMPEIGIPSIPRSIIKTKKSGIAAVLSFLIPGLGQIYRGRIGAGSIFVLIGLTLLELNKLLIDSPDFRILMPDIRDAAIPAIRENIPDIRIIIFIVIYIIFWIYNMHHAYTLDPEEMERQIKRQIEREIKKIKKI